MRIREVMLLTCVAACQSAASYHQVSDSPTDFSLPDWNHQEPPIVIGHRGSGNIDAPENTFAAFDDAAALGVALETDVRRSSDGVMVLMHDDSVLRTTGAAGQVSSLTYAELLKLDAARAYRPDVFSPQRIPSFEEYLRRYGTTNVLVPEMKETPEEGDKAIELIERMGMRDAVIIQSFFPPILRHIKDIDPAIRTAITATDTVAPSDAASYGVSAAFIQHTKIDQAYVQAMHSTGIRVFAWTVNNLTTAEHLLELGVDGFISDDPGLMLLASTFSSPGTTTVPIPSRVVGAGWRPYSSAFGWLQIVDKGFVTFTRTGNLRDDSFSRFYVPFLRSPDLTDTVTISSELKIAKISTSGTLPPLVGVRFCWSTDDDEDALGSSETQGYVFSYQTDGSVRILRAAGGAALVLGSARWSAITAGQVIPLRIEATLARISVTRPDTSQTITVDDQAYPRMGFVSPYGSGVVFGVGETTFAYTKQLQHRKTDGENLVP
jgi:glycerophosphoryl diester phosphodiesterase